MVLGVQAHAPAAVRVARVAGRRVRRRQRQRVLQLRRRPQDAQRVVGQLLCALPFVIYIHFFLLCR